MLFMYIVTFKNVAGLFYKSTTSQLSKAEQNKLISDSKRRDSTILFYRKYTVVFLNLENIGFTPGTH